MNHEKLAEQAMEAIRALASKATSGDGRAVEALRTIGCEAAGTLFNLRTSQAVIDAARAAETWPICRSSIAEFRAWEAAYVEGIDLGTSLPFKQGGGRGRPRDLSGGESAIAMNVLRLLEAARRDGGNESWERAAGDLPPLAADSIDRWADAGVMLCLWVWRYCGEKWDAFPWSEAIRAKAEAMDDNGHVRGIESAAREKIKAGLKRWVG